MIITVFKNTKRKEAFITVRKSYARRTELQCVKAAIKNDCFREFEHVNNFLRDYLLGVNNCKVEKYETVNDTLPDALYEVLGALRNARYKVQYIEPRKTAEERAAIKAEMQRLRDLTILDNVKRLRKLKVAA